MLYFWKVVLSAKDRTATLNKKTVAQANKCEIDLVTVANLTKRKVCKKVRGKRADIWQTQKDATQNRIEWLEINAQDRARAKKEIYWVKNMQSMVKLAKERGVNQKMTNAIKGP